jgi:hypothetical protein
MTDPDSPEIYAAPIETQLWTFIGQYRELLPATVDGLTEEEARRRLVPSMTTLLGLVKHAAMVERVWFEEAPTGLSRLELGIPLTPDESFALEDTDTIASVRASYAATVRASACRASASTTPCPGTGADRCPCGGSSCTCFASTLSTSGMRRSCANRSSPSARGILRRRRADVDFGAMERGDVDRGDLT